MAFSLTTGFEYKNAKMLVWLAEFSENAPHTEFEDDEMVRVLPCKHCEHDECLGQWLKMSKCCPLCQKEVEL